MSNLGRRSASAPRSGFCSAWLWRAAPDAVALRRAMRIAEAGRALFMQALLQVQLARIEWAQEKDRLLRMLVIVLLGFACLLCLMLFTGGLVLAATWETPYRIAAMACLTLMYSV